jgi:hypothetical protein
LIIEMELDAHAANLEFRMRCNRINGVVGHTLA